MILKKVLLGAVSIGALGAAAYKFEIVRNVGLGLGAFAIPIAIAHPWIIHALAQQKICWTVPAQNTVEAIMSGGSNGRFIRFTDLPDGLKYKGVGSNWDRWEIIKDDSPSETKPSSGFFGLKEAQGVQRIGWPILNSVYQYKFTYGKIINGADEKTRFERRTGVSNFVFIVDHPYGMIANQAETSDGFEMFAQFTATLRITNPYRALFGVTDWLHAVESKLSEIVKDYIGRFEYGENLWSEQTSQNRAGQLTNMIQKDLLEGAHQTIQEYMQDQYGVKFSDINIINVDPANEKDREIAKRKATARIEAEAALIEADGDAKVAERKAQGEAMAIRIVTKAKVDEKLKLGAAGVKVLKDEAAVAATTQGQRALAARTLVETGRNGNTIITRGDEALGDGALSKLVNQNGRPLT